MRALVTGASGFIGRILVRQLLDRGDDVVCLVRSTSRRDGLEGAGFVVGDIQDPDSLHTAMAGVDVVFHLASLLKMPWKPAFQTVNVQGTSNIAAAAAAQPTPPTLVIVSSLAAAGPALSAPHTEDGPSAPISIYGRVKLAAEQATADYPGRRVIVRPPMVFGTADTSALPMFKSIQRGFHAVPGRPAMKVSMIHVDDLAAGLIAAAGGEGLYYIAHRTAPAWDTLGDLIAEAIGVEPPRRLYLPAAVTWAVSALNELSGRLRDRPVQLNLDKHREAKSGDWLCSASRLEGLGWRAEALPIRLAQAGEWYRAEGWL
ncbi:MAG: dihydroflavonol-4-reductase [Myxococcota bacterium]|jgi:dihydroflavonol-4-reductase